MQRSRSSRLPWLRSLLKLLFLTWLFRGHNISRVFPLTARCLSLVFLRICPCTVLFQYFKVDLVQLALLQVRFNLGLITYESIEIVSEFFLFNLRVLTRCLVGWILWSSFANLTHYGRATGRLLPRELRAQFLRFLLLFFKAALKPVDLFLLLFFFRKLN